MQNKSVNGAFVTPMKILYKGSANNVDETASSAGSFHANNYNDSTVLSSSNQKYGANSARKIIRFHDRFKGKF